MNAQPNVVRLAAPRMQCSSCGTTVSAGCDCGVPYVTAGVRAAEAVTKNPEMSDRAIAAEIGVGNKTVSRARGKATVSHDTVATRTGKDGKSRVMPTPKPVAEPVIQEECGTCRTDEERWQHSLGSFAGDAISMQAFWKREFGRWQKFAVPSSLMQLADEAAKAWEQLANELRERTDV